MPLPPDDTTRQRLIEAAGQTFADLGFRNATIRDISTRAGANVAAVNYHFGDKHALYSEVLRYAHLCAITKYPPHMGLPPKTRPEKKLEAFVQSFLLRLLDTGRPAWHARLMARELAEPTAALDVLVHEQIKPHFLGLLEIIRKLLKKDAPESALRATCSSIVGQCLFYHFGAPITARLFPDKKYTASDVDALAAHITRFSLAGIRAIGISLKAPTASASQPRRAQKVSSKRSRQPTT